MKGLRQGSPREGVTDANRIFLKLSHLVRFLLSSSQGMSNYVDLTRTPPSKRRKVSSPMKENVKNASTPIRALKKLFDNDEEDEDSDDWVDAKDDPMDVMFSHQPIAPTQSKRLPQGRGVTKIEKMKPESPMPVISLGPVRQKLALSAFHIDLPSLHSF